MKKVIIYFTEDKRCYQVICPFRQEGKDRDLLFDGNWRKLVDHVTRSHGDVKNYWKFEVI